MDIRNGNSNKKSTGNFRLGKEEILRGYNSYQEVIQNSVLVSTEFLKAFVKFKSKKQVSKDIIQSPPVTGKVMVGFVIAKKKIKKASHRNRLRRLLKESYRLNKRRFREVLTELNVIFGLNDKCYDFYRKDQRLKLEFINTEMIKLMDKIILKINSQK